MVNKNGHRKHAEANSGVGFANDNRSAVNAAPKAAANKDEAKGNEAKGDEIQGGLSAETESLNKIRDILFGEQVQTHEQRFEQLEQRVEDECDRLRKDFQTDHSKTNQNPGRPLSSPCRAAKRTNQNRNRRPKGRRRTASADDVRKCRRF